MERKSRRSLRVALVLGAAVAGTALVGWGGLAAWSAYTENAGNSVAAGTLAHTNGPSCVSNLGSTPTSGGGPTAGWCAAAITVANVDPAFGLPVTGQIKIANTGSLQSNFAMSMPAAAVPSAGTICQDLTLAVTDLNGATDYTAAPLSTQMGSFSLKNNASTPNTLWSPNGTAGSGTGATGNTFTFTVAALVPNFANDPTDAGQSCTFNILFTQTAA